MLKNAMAAVAALTLVAAPTASAVAADDHKSKKSYGMEGKKKDIVDTAVATESLSTLVAAVKAGDLVATLKSEGPFTVFAPTNAAFASIQSTVDTLLQPANKAQLQRVLTAHVVPGRLDAGELVMLAGANGGSVNLTTASGDTLVVEVTGGKVFLVDENGGRAEVVQADVGTKNGVVHVINAVLVPKT